MPRGIPQIEISYDMDSNGILNVSAVENMLNANEQAGQMTTQTLGFSQ